MKMRVSGLEGMELDGSVSRIHVADGHIVLNVRLKNPVGWEANSQMSRQDVWRVLGMILKRPAVLAFLLFGYQNRRK